MHSEKEEFISKERAIEDLKVIKRMIEETRIGILPGMSVLIFWGIWLLIGNLFTQIMIWYNQPPLYIGIGWLTLLGIAVIFNALFWSRVSRSIKGMHPYLSKQLGYIWWTLMGMSGILHAFGFPLDILTEPRQIGFMWTSFISAALCITGIIYSREFFFGGLFAYIGIFVAAAFKNYTWLLLGIFLCLASIIPFILAQRKFKAQENE